MFKYFTHNEFVRNVGKLLTGSVIAQAVPLAFSPVLTRIYSPEEFGVVGVYIALVTVIGVVVTGRYELAITQPEKDDEAKGLFFISFIVSCSISLLCFLVVVLFDDKIITILSNENLRNWLYLIPLSVFLLGVFQSLSYLANRYKRYSTIATSKVAQSFTTLGGNLALSSTKPIASGLIVGHVFGQLLAVLVLCYVAVKKNILCLKRMSVFDLICIANKYKRFPLISAPGAILNTIALQLPILFISKAFDLVVVGYFNFVYRIIGGPMSLLSVAVSQVLIQKISVKDEDIPLLIKRLSLKLFFLSLPIVIIILMSGPVLFSFIFGERWANAGEMAKVLIFSIAIRFVVSPLSMVLAMKSNLHLAFLWQLYSCVSVIFCVYVFGKLPVQEFLFYYVLQDVLAYLVYYFVILYGAKKL